jgi:protein-tyrosine phosphatase
LTILDTLKGLYKAREYKFFDLAKFDIEEYEHYEQVENGDLNWCMDGKFIAFAGPHAERQFSPGGYHTLRPDDYVSYFRKKNVTLVVRLNKPYYDAKKFSNHGIDHMELYFLDGSNPPDQILAKFLARAEETPGAVAVHCKAGLGRTGSCIGAYMMKHFKLTAEEVIGWLRIVRPGSVIGPQQQYLKDLQNRMWREGDLMRPRQLSSLPAVVSAKDESSESGSGRHGSLNRPGSSGSNGLGNALPSAPTTPQSSSATKRFNKLSISGSTASSSQSPVMKLNASSPPANNMMSNGTNTLLSSTGKQGSYGILSSANKSPTTSFISPSMGSSRPSSRGPARPTESLTASATMKEETDIEGSQGDQLRIRRQQHLQNSAVYSLTASSTSTPPKNRLSFGFSSTSEVTSNTKITLSGSNNGNGGLDSPQSGNNTPSGSSRPKSRLGGFLSAWNK